MLSGRLIGPVGIVTFFESAGDALGLPTQHIVIVFVHIHHFLEVVLASLDASNELLVDRPRVPNLRLNSLLRTLSLCNQTVNFTEDSSLLFLSLRT